MRNVSTIATERMTVEEYIQFELTADRRHEYVNGQLIEMPGEKGINNRIAGKLYAWLLSTLTDRNYEVYINNVKVGIPGGEKYYYPDVFVTNEKETELNQYIKYEPQLIVEVISPGSHITDTVDKYIDYTTIPSLQYYLIIEPETIYVTLYSRNTEGKWEAMPYVRRTDVIPLPALSLELPLALVYPE